MLDQANKTRNIYFDDLPPGTSCPIFYEKILLVYVSGKNKNDKILFRASFYKKGIVNRNNVNEVTCEEVSILTLNYHASPKEYICIVLPSD